MHPWWTLADTTYSLAQNIILDLIFTFMLTLYAFFYASLEYC